MSETEDLPPLPPINAKAYNDEELEAIRPAVELLDDTATAKRLFATVDALRQRNTELLRLHALLDGGTA